MHIDASAITATRATKQIVAMTQNAALNPHPGPDSPAPCQGSVRVFFDDQGGPGGVFSVSVVGARIGKMFLGENYYGNASPAHRLAGYRDIRQALERLPRLTHGPVITGSGAR